MSRAVQCHAEMDEDQVRGVDLGALDVTRVGRRA